MGLDMYLSASMHVSGYDFSDATDREKYLTLIESMSAEGIADRDTPSATVSVTCAYWRKANAIHQWFVLNVQAGVDDCGTYYVEPEKLQQLRALCVAVMDDHSKAAELLPSQPGFFFGSTDYDEWYFQDLERTVAELDRVLKATEQGGWSFEYHSSW